MSDFLTFDEAAHEYRFKGVVVPSVTQILQQVTDFSHINPTVLARKAQIGTATHLACELDDAGDLDEASVPEEVRPYLDAWRLFRLQNDTVVELSESRVFHSTHRYAGTLDRVMLVNGERAVVDIKTSAVLGNAVGLQLAAYDMALGTKKLKRYALQSKPNGTYRMEEYKDPNDYAVFIALLTIQNWRNKHAN